MIQPLAVRNGLAPLVAFVEETEPDEILPAAIARLRDGTPPIDLLAAAAVAVSRSTEVPFDHHGGPLHMVTGIRAVAGAAGRLRGDWRMLPILHSVVLANGQVHSPAMGPHVMAELGECGLAGDAAAAAFLEAMHEQLPIPAERHLRAVLRARGPAGTLALILEPALRRHALDDHFLLYPIFAARTLDLIGWEWAEFVLRPVVRWLASPPLSVMHGDDSSFFLQNLAVYHRFAELEALADGLPAEPRLSGGAAEANAVADLAANIGAVEDFDALPAMMAGALAAGLSLEGVVDALSAGAATIQVRTDYGNPLDVHMHNGVSVRRYLARMPGLPMRTRLLALLSWPFGPEIRLSQTKLRFGPRLDTAGLPRDGAALLDELSAAVAAKPPVGPEVRRGGGRARMVADAGARHAMALAQAYAEGGHDPALFQRRIAEIVCRDSFTEMHGFEHADDAAREHEHLDLPQKAAHMAASAKVAYCGWGIDQAVFARARPHLSL